MEFEYIDIIFNSSGNVAYESFPNFINQFSSNYKLRVGFLNPAYKPERIFASIKTVSNLPERYLFPDSSEELSINGVPIYNISSYQLSQYDTRLFSSEFELTINVIYEGTVFNHTFFIPMKRASFFLQGVEDTSLVEALVNKITELEYSIQELETKIENLGGN